MLEPAGLALVVNWLIVKMVTFVMYSKQLQEKNPKYNRESGQFVSYNIHTANYTYINYK